jgi:hypothetical protein
VDDLAGLPEPPATVPTDLEQSLSALLVPVLGGDR